MTGLEKSSNYYRRAGLRFVYFTTPVYCIFFLIIFLARHFSLTDFTDAALYLGMGHIMAIELLALTVVLKIKTFSKQDVKYLLWAMVWNNCLFFSYWVFYLHELRSIMYALVCTNTITLFTVASFRSALLHNILLCPMLIMAAYLGSPEANIFQAVGSDIVHVTVFFVVAIWLCFLSGQYTKQRKKLAETVSKLNESSEQLAKESRAKSEFLAKMSHEIRTPMNGVLGMLQLLNDDTLSSKHQQYVSTAYNSAQALLGVINDILDFSKIEAGKLQLETIPFDIKQLLVESTAIFQVMANEKGISLVADIATNTPQFVAGDPTRIRQIILNLLSNAVKFTDKGSVNLRSRMLELNDHYQFYIEIQDTGLGISAACQQQLFASFQQADSSTSRRFGGTGLGLAICKQLIELMGGEIGIRSEEKQGSTFWFTMRLNKADQQHSVAVKPLTGNLYGKSLQGIKVLVADDNSVNQLVVSGMLQKLGIQHRVFGSGLELLDYYREHHADYDIVLMDCEMPELDGYQTTQQLRQFERSENISAKPVIALTAHAVKEYLDKCITFGMVDVIIKPLELEQLGRSLHQWAPKKSASPIEENIQVNTPLPVIEKGNYLPRRH